MTNEQTATLIDWNRIAKKLRDAIEDAIDTVDTGTPAELEQLAAACASAIALEANLRLLGQ